MAKYEGGVYSTQKKIFHSHELAKNLPVKLSCIVTHVLLRICQTTIPKINVKKLCTNTRQLFRWNTLSYNKVPKFRILLRRRPALIKFFK
jgi:hypothetical protein